MLSPHIVDLRRPKVEKTQDHHERSNASPLRRKHKAAISKKKFIGNFLQVLAVSSTALFTTTGVVYASLTFTGTGITSDGALNLTGAATSTLDFGSSTMQLHTTNNGPITTGSGSFLVGGNLKVNNTTISWHAHGIEHGKLQKPEWHPFCKSVSGWFRRR